MGDSRKKFEEIVEDRVIINPFSVYSKKIKLLIIGNARHGKDTVAEMINKHFNLTFKSSSRAAADIFIFEALKDKYDNAEDCFSDRVNHRKEWHDMICEYNKEDPSRLAKEIMKTSNIYVGMRSSEEIKRCKEDEIFDLVVGVYNKNKLLEPKESFSIDLWEESDLVISNSGTLEDLEDKVVRVFNKIL